MTTIENIVEITYEFNPGYSKSCWAKGKFSHMGTSLTAYGMGDTYEDAKNDLLKTIDKKIRTYEKLRWVPNDEVVTVSTILTEEEAQKDIA